MPVTRRILISTLIGATLLGGVAGAHAADDYPSRPITLVVPYSPGGATDNGGRIVADALTTVLGQNVVIDNRPGASGTVGATYASQAEPDGYTLLLGNTATHGAPRQVYESLAYNPIDSFIPISLLYKNNLGIAVSADFPASTFPEFIDYVSANPGTVSYAIPGFGTVQQLAAAVLSQKAGLEMEEIPYSGTGPAMVDLVGGHVPVDFTSMSAATEFYASGQIKVLALLGGERAEGFEEFPTVSETYPGFDYSGWGGLFAPAGTDPAIIEKLNAALQEAYKDPKVTDALKAVGLAPVTSTSAELVERTTLLLENWDEVIAAGFTVID